MCEDSREIRPKARDYMNSPIKVLTLIKIEKATINVKAMCFLVDYTTHQNSRPPKNMSLLCFQRLDFRQSYKV
jgi:hypothetical protein